MIFRFILEHYWTRKLAFVTVSDCLDRDDAINHIHKEFKDYEIDKVTEVKP